jgi:hypothetical protein
VAEAVMQPGHGTDTTGWRQRYQQQWQWQVLPAGAAAAEEGQLVGVGAAAEEGLNERRLVGAAAGGDEWSTYLHRSERMWRV